MRITALSIVLTFCSLFAARAVGDVPPATYLNTPTNGEERLFPASDSEIKSEERYFELATEDECIFKVFCGGALYPGFAVAVSHKTTGSFVVIGIRVRRDDKSQEKLIKSSAVLESALGERLIQVAIKEFSRIVPGSSEKRLFVDTNTYLYWAKVRERSYAGKTVESQIVNSRLGRFERLSQQLCELSFASALDRTEVMGAIDRSISEIELANKFLK